jgi:hypothetical protein
VDLAGGLDQQLAAVGEKEEPRAAAEPAVRSPGSTARLAASAPARGTSSRRR